MNAINNADIADATEQLDLLLDTISRMRSPIFLQNFISSFIRRLSERLVKSGKQPEKILDRQTLERLYLPETYHDDLRSYFIEVTTWSTPASLWSAGTPTAPWRSGRATSGR